MRIAWTLLFLFFGVNMARRKIKCGQPTVRKDQGFHIYNGEKALKGQWPWMVSIEVRHHVDLTTYQHLCGGALLENGWILTAAHCFEYEDSRQYRIVLGQHNILEEEEANQYFNIKVLIHHENFWLHETDDIAIIKLDGEINLTDWVQPICFLREGDTLDKLDDMMENDDKVMDCNVAGWGFTEHGTRSEELLYTAMNIWPRQRCTQTFKEEDFDPRTNLCAQNKDSPLKDACKADSGGPIFCRRYSVDKQKWDRWRIHGVVSWGGECGKKANPPGVYTNVLAYKNWIEEKIKEYENET